MVSISVDLERLPTYSLLSAQAAVDAFSRKYRCCCRLQWPGNQRLQLKALLLFFHGANFGPFGFSAFKRSGFVELIRIHVPMFSLFATIYLLASQDLCQLQYISVDQLQRISVDQLQHISVGQLQYISVGQLQFISVDQLQYICWLATIYLCWLVTSLLAIYNTSLLANYNISLFASYNISLCWLAIIYLFVGQLQYISVGQL